MSGVEALAVIGIIANTIQLADFGCKTLKRVKDYIHDARGIPKAFGDVQTVLPLISTALRETQRQVSSGQVPENTCKSLNLVLQECEIKLGELGTILKEVLPRDGASRITRGLKALASLSQDKKVEEIARGLWIFLQVLTYHHVVSVPTRQEIMALIGSFPQPCRADTHVDGGKPRLTDRLRTSSQFTTNAHFMVPVQSSDDFTGREEVMIELSQKLCLPDKHCRLALVGLGGIGKTRVALQFARKFRQSTETSVFWIYARNVERMKKSFSDIARRVGIPGCEGEGVDILRLVKGWFEDEAAGKWLLVVDNADDDNLLYSRDLGAFRLADYFPRSENGSILLTTRYDKVGRRFATTNNIIILSALTMDESESLLATRLGLGKPTPASYRELAEQLEWIPLALVQAASFISVNSVSVAKYLQLYRQSDLAKVQLLSEDFEDEVRDPESKNAISTTWSISFEYISSHDSKAVELLSLMSMLDSQTIHESLLPKGTDEIVFEKALGTLQAFSFISIRYTNAKSQDRCLDFHRLVRLATRNWLSMTGSFDMWTSFALKRLAGLCRDANNYDTRSQLLPHAVEILAADQIQAALGPDYLPTVFSGRTLEKNCVADDAICPECTSSLLTHVATTYEEAEDFAAAKIYTQRDIAIKKHILGHSHESTLKSLERLVVVTTKLSQFCNAEILCRRLSETSKAELGPAHCLTLRSLAMLIAIMRRSRTSLEEAEAKQKQLLDFCEQSINQTADPSNLKRLTIAAQIHYDSGTYSEAARYQVRAVNGYISNMGPAWPATSKAITRLIDIYILLEQYDEAETYARLVLEFSTEQRGTKHPESISLMLTLSRILRGQSKSSGLADHKPSKFFEAEKLASSALTLTAEVLGRNSPTYWRRKSNYEKYFTESPPNNVQNTLKEHISGGHHSKYSYSLGALGYFKYSDQVPVRLDYSWFNQIPVPLDGIHFDHIPVPSSGSSPNTLESEKGQPSVSTQNEGDLIRQRVREAWGMPHERSWDYLTNG